MIDPKTVLVGIPCHDGRVMTELCGMLIANAGKFGSITMPTECSHPSLVRNIIADTFLRSPFQWLVGIDSDIVPGPADFDYLLQEIDPTARYFEASDDLHGTLLPPTPSRILLGHAPAQPADALVCAEYAYKEDEFRPVQYGGGFYRVHRSVFEALRDLRHSPGDTVEVSRAAVVVLRKRQEECRELVNVDYPWGDIGALLDSVQDQASAPRLWQASHRGRVFYDYYPSGPLINTTVPGGSEWKGEDHGFWTLCHLAGLIPRIERRTRLLHIGRKAYPYLGPDEGVQQ
jgi:hypothetical protein